MYKKYFALFKHAYKLLQRNDPLILSAATAFFATFAISPIIIILMNVLTLYFEKDTIRPQVFKKIAATFGQGTAQEIESIVDNFRLLESDISITAISTIFFLFVATTLITVIRRAIHRIWRLHKKPRRQFRYTLKERIVGVALILLTGILFLIALVTDASVSIFRDYLNQLIPSVDATLIRIVNFIFSIAVVTSWFMLVFKILPEARVRWKVAFTGGFFTAILFSAGKFIMGKILLGGRIAALFGASASIALLLLFIFYSSLILYFGAAFTFEFGKHTGRPVLPGKYTND